MENTNEMELIFDSSPVCILRLNSATFSEIQST